MQDSNKIYEPSLAKILIFLFMLSLELPILAASINYFKIGTILAVEALSMVAIYLFIIIVVFFILNKIIKNRSISFIIVLTIGFIFNHSDFFLYKFMYFVPLHVAYIYNVTFVLLLMVFVFFTCLKYVGGRRIYDILVTIFLTIFTLPPAISLTYEYIYQNGVSEVNVIKKENVDFSNNPKVGPDQLPDIYYIMPDMYGSFDLLDNEYGFDNIDFYNDLTDRGFYVEKDSYSSYVQTVSSLSALANMDYVQSNFENYNPEMVMEVDIIKTNLDSRVVNILRDYNYEFLETGLIAVTLGTNRMSSTVDLPGLKVTTFKGFVYYSLASTLVPQIMGLYHGDLIYNEIGNKYSSQTLQTFDNMDKSLSVETDKPKFVFSHFMAPHNPFVFDRDGNIIPQNRITSLADCCPTPKKYVIDGKEHIWNIDRRAYIEQALYVNKRIIEHVDKIKDSSTRPYIIIIQADHGPQSLLDFSNPTKEGVKERLSILSAVYASDGKNEMFHNNMNHVNIFRNIFNKYFGFNLDMLPYKAYFSDYTNKGDFKEVTHVVKGK